MALLYMEEEQKEYLEKYGVAKVIENSRKWQLLKGEK